jgi:predicted RNA-binding protein Jag
MTIKFYCDNGHTFEKTEEEIRNSGQEQRFCFCGSKLHISHENLKEITIQDIKDQVKKYVNDWGKKMGIEGAIELIERNKNSVSEKIYNLYKEEIESRGFILK